MEANKLEIGKRYWLDCMKDVSGIYVGEVPETNFNSVEGRYFSDIEGNHPYIEDDRGCIGFPLNDLDFYEYEN